VPVKLGLIILSIIGVCIIFNMMKEAITWQKQKQKIQILGLIENP
jgi:F0F1-type ATP synthase assembly protein I